MAVIGIVGDIGSGKTLLMTYLGYQGFNSGSTIYANYKLNFQHKNIDTIRDLSDMITFPNMILLDEAWTAADSRKTQSYMNIALSKMVLQSRKRQADLFYTTQNNNQIDIRIRQITHLYIVPEITHWTTENVPVIIKAYFYKVDGSGKTRECGIKLFDVYNTHLLYNTNEVVDSMKGSRHIDLVKKFKDFEGTRAELAAVLHAEEGFSKSDSVQLSNYVMYKINNGEANEEVHKKGEA